jgi:hypothetical protein
MMLPASAVVHVVSTQLVGRCFYIPRIGVDSVALAILESDPGGAVVTVVTPGVVTSST